MDMCLCASLGYYCHFVTSHNELCVMAFFPWTWTALRSHFIYLFINPIYCAKKCTYVTRSIGCEHICTGHSTFCYCPTALARTLVVCIFGIEVWGYTMGGVTDNYTR
jgi:hypothetical protein